MMRNSNSADALLLACRHVNTLTRTTCAGANVESLDTAVQLVHAATDLVAVLAREVAEAHSAEANAARQRRDG